MNEIRLAHALDAELGHELVETLAVQHVELHEGPASAPHLVHGRLIQAPPFVRKELPVHAGDPARFAEGLTFAKDARAPVHHRAEHVERQGLDRHGYASTGRFCCHGRAFSKAAAAWSTVRSAKRRPTTCRPTGSPAFVNPQGNEQAGCPVKLKG